MAVPTVETITEVLLREWDPLCVAESNESPEAEYRPEAEELRVMLTEGTTADEIVHYLTSRRLGHSDGARDRRVAATLLTLAE